MCLLPTRAVPGNSGRFGKSDIFAVWSYTACAVKKLLSGKGETFLIYIAFAAVLFSCILIAGCRREVPREKGLSDINQPLKIRVLLNRNRKSIRFKSDSPARIISDESALKSLRFDRLESSIKINTSNGRINIGGWACPDDELVLRTEDGKFSINERVYRGSLKLKLSANPPGFDIVNIVGLESYLAGVTGAEMPSYWEQSALEAQTITARSYALHIKRRFAADRHWDVRKTQANQVYKGVSAETPAITKIVRKTYGKVLFYKSPETGNFKILPAYYSSICGGHTADSRNVFSGKPIPPLKGVMCPHCRQIANPDFFFWGEIVIDKDECRRKLINNYPSLKNLGTITGIRIKKRENYGDFARAISVVIKGENGEKKTISAENLRLTLDSSGMDFRSTIFEIEDGGSSWIFKNGRGFGHGVGMCQYGAEKMARDGKTSEQILNYYYPGAPIRNIYENR